MGEFFGGFWEKPPESPEKIEESRSIDSLDRNVRERIERGLESAGEEIFLRAFLASRRGASLLLDGVFYLDAADMKDAWRRLGRPQVGVDQDDKDFFSLKTKKKGGEIGEIEE